LSDKALAVLMVVTLEFAVAAATWVHAASMEDSPFAAARAAAQTKTCACLKSVSEEVHLSDCLLGFLLEALR
jgi:hypothetical protein